MNLINNINFLRENFKSIYDKHKNYNEDSEQLNLCLENSVDNNITLLVENNSNYMSIHSRYNPTEEAKLILKEYENVLPYYNHILFYGVGLGYILEEFNEKYPNKEFSIYEPIEGIFNQFINYKNINYKYLENICLGLNEQEISNFLENVFKNGEESTLIIVIPAYRRIFNEQYKMFMDKLNIFIKSKRSSLATDYGFQKRWTTNSIKNFQYTLNTPDIFAENIERFKGKVGILVAAGPSLNFEFENLKYIKEHNMAYIFSVGSATDILLRNGIVPHAATSYDPGEANIELVFKSLIERNEDNFPLIYGSSIGYEVLENYRGPKLHMITSQDTISDYYLRNENNNKFNVISDAPSIAILTVELFCKLGCSTLLLVGQNLSYYNNEYYASGLDKERNFTTDVQGINTSTLKVKDVYGNDVNTSIGFIQAKNQMEMYIKAFSDVEVINTTKGGANIEGTKFIELEKLISDRLIENSIDNNFYNTEKTQYNFDYLRKQHQNMNENYKEFVNLTNEIESILDKIKVLVRNNNYKQLETIYPILDKAYLKLNNNSFFNIFVIPMNRVNYKYLRDKISLIRFEKNALTKAETIINEFKKFIFICRKEIKESIEPLYDELNEMIEKKLSQL